jgi:hypothetical protein
LRSSVVNMCRGDLLPFSYFSKPELYNSSLSSFYLEWDTEACFLSSILKRWKSKVISLHLENKSLWCLFQTEACTVLLSDHFLNFRCCAECYHTSQSLLHFWIWSTCGSFGMEDTFLTKCQPFLLLLLLLSQFLKSYALT